MSSPRAQISDGRLRQLGAVDQSQSAIALLIPFLVLGRVFLGDLGGSLPPDSVKNMKSVNVGTGRYESLSIETILVAAGLGRARSDHDGPRGMKGKK